MSVDMFSSMCTFICMQCTCVQDQGSQKTDVIYQFTLFLEVGSLSNQVWHSDHEADEFTCLCISGIRIINMNYHIYDFFGMISGDQTQGSNA